MERLLFCFTNDGTKFMPDKKTATEVAVVFLASFNYSGVAMKVKP